MKLLIASPTTGGVKSVEVEDDTLRKTSLFEHRLGHEIDGALFGEAFKGYVFKITGGQDKEGFPMKQGVVAASRVLLYLTPGTLGFQKWRARDGERKRRSVRGCILGQDLASLNMVIVKKGPSEIEGLTDVSHPRRLGPKRANKIRRLFNLTDEDVRKFVVRRTCPAKEHADTKKTRAYTKAPKIQRLIEPSVLRRRALKRTQRLTKVKAAKVTRKTFISSLLQKRRDQRLAKSSLATKKTRLTLKKQVAAVKEAKKKIFESTKKTTQPKDTKKKAKK